MNKAFMVSPPIGATSIAVEPLGFRKIFCLCSLSDPTKVFRNLGKGRIEGYPDSAFGLLFGIKVKS